MIDPAAANLVDRLEAGIEKHNLRLTDCGF
jgi:hypothetical protein